MSKNHAFSKKVTDYFYDHPIQKGILKEGGTLIVCAISAFLFAFGFRCFLAPSNLDILPSSQGMKLVSGGVSGVSQTLIALVDLISGGQIEKANIYDVIYSTLYFGLNIPVFIIAWRGIGKRFAIFTFINVLLASLFSTLLRYADEGWLNPISAFVDENGGLVTRALLAAITIGISSAIAFRVNISAGGIDVISYYIGLKRGTLVGRYSVYINAGTITLFTLITITDKGWGTTEGAHVFVATLFSILYLFVVMFVIDAINLRNKKMRVEVVSENPDLGRILIGNLPHGATMVSGKGAFTGKDKYLFRMVVSSYEVKQTISVIKKADPSAFIEVVELKHVYGRFFLPPIK